MSGEYGSMTEEAQYSNSDSDSMNGTKSDWMIVERISSKLERRVKQEEFRQSDIHGRLQIIEGMFSRYESLVTIEPLKIPKSNYESFKYDHFGSQEESLGNYNEALILYNMSIAFAEVDYQHLYSLYEKRANALRAMKLFKASLHSLELVIKYCPSDLKEEYEGRKAAFMLDYNNSQSIEESLNSECQIDIDSLTKIANDRKHPNVPFIANCLELHHMEHYGRGITTNCDLNPGDVVAIDRAYATILRSSVLYRHCSSCLKENWSLIPCPDCTTAMYCNQKCLQIAWKKFHKHECKISNYLMKIFPDNYLMYFRTPLQTIELFGGIDPLIEFEETSQQEDIESCNIFNVNHRDIQYEDDGEVVHYPDNESFNSRVTVSNYYPVHGLIKNVSEPSNWRIDAYLDCGVFTFLIFRLFRDIFNITTDNQKRFVETFIYRHVLAAITFNYGLYTGRGKKADSVYGAALYPFASLINHSCAPNIIMDKNGSSASIIVMHPIKAGGQLFNYYGPHYLFAGKLKRHKDIESTWNFTCRCKACEEDYPLVHGYPTCCIPSDSDEGLRIPFTNLELKKLIEDIKALYMFRRSHLKFYPCKEICYYEFDVTLYLTQLLRRLPSSNNEMCDDSDSSSDETQYSNSEGRSEEARQEEAIDKIILLLMQGLPKDFKTFDIHERVESIESRFSTFESKIRIQPMRLPKSNNESLRYKELGHEEIAQGNFNKGLFLYNKSIAFAEKDSEYLHNVYERRAYVLEAIKLFKASLHSFELAIKYCPSNLQKKFEKRKKEMIQENSTFLSKEKRTESECQTDINALTQLENDRKHPDVPFIANCLELRDTEYYGRGIFTNCDLNPGDVVAIDRAYATVLYSTYQYRHCSSCFKENWSLIPCPDCTTAMYCNQKCLQIAWQKFHKHECGISNYLTEIFPKMEKMWFIASLQTIELFGGIDPLIEFEEMSQQMYGGSFSVFDMRHENIQYDDVGELVNYADNEKFNSRVTPLNYHPVHGLIKDIAEPSNWPIDLHVRTAVGTFLIYRLFHDIFNITTNNQKRFVEKFVYRHVLAAMINNYSLEIGTRMKVAIQYGAVLYPFLSLINHSCAPNLLLDKEGSSGTIIVLHPIKAGDQLFGNYGYHHFTEVKLERQAELRSWWGFTCQCIACVQDYPIRKKCPRYCLPCEQNDMLSFNPTNVKFKKLIKYLKELFMFRRSHVKFYPCWEICRYDYYVRSYFKLLLRQCSGSVHMKC